MGIRTLLAALALVGTAVLGGCGGGHTTDHTVIPVGGSVHHTCYHTTHTTTTRRVRGKIRRTTVTHKHVAYAC